MVHCKKKNFLFLSVVLVKLWTRQEIFLFPRDNNNSGVSCAQSNFDISMVISYQNQDIAPHLEKGSSVIFITSIAAFQPQVPTAMYGVTKTALLGLTKVPVMIL